MHEATFRFGNSQITFQFDDNNIMVNATEMARSFGKKVEPFTRNEDTKRFIEACIKSENSSFLKLEDVIISKQKTGTFMHRYLAIKFAAWLNPEFELWVIQTIDRILFSKYQKQEKSLKESAARKKRIKELEEEISQNMPDSYEELQNLISIEKKESNWRGRQTKEQIEFFLEKMSDN